MAAPRVLVIGAGMGGLAAAADLARRGAAVTVLERAAAPGGKMREVMVGGSPIDGGPTVFTMRWIFEGLFADAGASLEAALPLQKADILARHAWRAGGRLDLFADIARSADAIGEFAGAAEARGYRAFCARSADIFRTLRGSFIAAERPSPLDLVKRVGFTNIGALIRTAPMKTLWDALGEHFRDPRLRQLFGRYATYCGCSPWLAPATLMLVAHVEQDGVWFVKGGMRRVADAIQRLAEAKGAEFRFGAEVAELLRRNGRVAGVRLANGEELSADAVVFNGDASALRDGLLSNDVRQAVPSKAPPRSLSAVTWSVYAKAKSVELDRHNDFFHTNYSSEFEDIFKHRKLPHQPTVYVCAQDQPGHVSQDEPQRLLCLVNAPAVGDSNVLNEEALAQCQTESFQHLERLGLKLEITPFNTVRTSPTEFHQRFPASAGALYGQATHGWTSLFSRPGSKTPLPGLFLAGGSVHPGPGVPMAAMSGRLAAEALMASHASTKLFPQTATSGGTSTL